MTAEPAVGSPACPSRDWHSAFDLSDPTFGDQFEQIADDLVANCPLARTVDDEWVASRYADVSRVLLESDLFSSGSGIRGAKFHPKADELLKPNEMDQPEHGWLRHSWDRHFTRAAITQHEPSIREIVNGLIDGFVDDGQVDLVGQFADPLACRAFCQAVANMPVEDMPFLQKHFQAALTAPSIEARTESWMATHEYVGTFLQQRKRERAGTTSSTRS